MSSQTALPERAATPKATRSAPSVNQAHDHRIVVVYVIDNMRLGGTELNAVRTAERLDRQRYDLRVVCLGEDGPLTDRYRAIGVPVKHIAIRSFYGWSMLRSGFHFMRYVRQVEASIVHAHDVYSNIFAAVWAPLAGVPVLITSRRWWNSLPNRMLALGNQFAFARSTAILANSRAVAALVAEESPAVEGKIHTVTNFVDDLAFSAVDHGDTSAWRAWGAPENSVVIGCVARLDPLKDHRSLLRAFAIVHEREPRTFLVLVGGGGLRAELQELSQQLGVSDAVRFTGEVKSSSNLHRDFDISVLASISEGFPNTIVEAMAAGKPVVATRVGGSVDAVVHEQTGLLVRPSDPDELATAILLLVRDPVLRSSYGRAGEERARQSFSESPVLESLTAMYRTLVETRRR